MRKSVIAIWAVLTFGLACLIFALVMPIFNEAKTTGTMTTAVGPMTSTGPTVSEISGSPSAIRDDDPGIITPACSNQVVQTYSRWRCPKDNETQSDQASPESRSLDRETAAVRLLRSACLTRLAGNRARSRCPQLAHRVLLTSPRLLPKAKDTAQELAGVISAPAARLSTLQYCCRRRVVRICAVGYPETSSLPAPAEHRSRAGARPPVGSLTKRTVDRCGRTENFARRPPPRDTAERDPGLV